MKNNVPVSPSCIEALKIAIDAYIYGYPLVLMDVTRAAMTAVARPGPHKAPVNQFAHQRRLPDHMSTDAIHLNVDTLESKAWIDLSTGPIVLSVPNVGNRYYSIQLIDAWTNVFAALGSRTTGYDKAHFAIVGRRWVGKLPEKVRVIFSPTRFVLLIGRTLTHGKKDYLAVHGLQDQYRLTPLNAWGDSFARTLTIPVNGGGDTLMSAVQQVANMDAAAFFKRLNTLMKDNPPAYDDSTTVSQFARIGIVPGWPFDTQCFADAVVETLNAAVRAAQTRIIAETKRPHGVTINGWAVPCNTANFGTDYVRRAGAAMSRLGATSPNDMIYRHAIADREGKPLTGENNYVLRFEEYHVPPVNGVWSITVYDSEGRLVENSLGRYALGDMDEIKPGDDGSYTIYLQRSSPGPENEQNWLPTPAGAFTVFLRLYWPKDQAIRGSWFIPPIKKMA